MNNSVLHDITGSAWRQEVFLDGRKDPDRKFPRLHPGKSRWDLWEGSSERHLGDYVSPSRKWIKRFVTKT